LQTQDLEPAAGQSPRLLIVDDVAANRDLLARRFAVRGFQIVEAESGARALELIYQQSFDTVLLDIVMPDVDGLEVLTEIRRHLGPAALPVIMVTGKDTSEDVVRALSLGANDYVSKPVDFAVAHARVCSQVARKRAEEAVGRLLAQVSDAKARVEEAVHVHLQSLSRDGDALGRTQLSVAQRQLLEDLRASAEDLAVSISSGWKKALLAAA
jgi:DNA-binding response OmpR family regulator